MPDLGEINAQNAAAQAKKIKQLIKNDPRQALRYFNASIALLTTSAFIAAAASGSQPRLDEYGLDITTHTAEYFYPNTAAFHTLGLFINTYRLLQASHGFFSTNATESSIPGFANGIDISLHLMNLLTHLAGLGATLLANAALNTIAVPEHVTEHTATTAKAASETLKTAAKLVDHVAALTEPEGRTIDQAAATVAAAKQTIADVTETAATIKQAVEQVSEQAVSTRQPTATAPKTKVQAHPTATDLATQAAGQLMSAAVSWFTSPKTKPAQAKTADTRAPASPRPR